LELRLVQRSSRVRALEKTARFKVNGGGSTGGASIQWLLAGRVCRQRRSRQAKGAFVTRIERDTNGEISKLC
jgi:hypothetical protein